MKTSSQPSARILASLLVGHGVTDVVVCPGSRNAPLIVALAAQSTLKLRTVIDERSAAFIALGMALQSMRPVAVVCTSGSAVLNFAPAVAEAYYRGVPLIVVSADRPAAWIDQDDSQTIRQPGALANVVKHTVDIGSDLTTPTKLWHANRLINDAIIAASDLRPGPVHINIQLDNPLGAKTIAPDDGPENRVIRVDRPKQVLEHDKVRALASELLDKRVLVLLGFMEPNSKITSAVDELLRLHNVIVFNEAQTNLHGRARTVGHIDATLKMLTDDQLQEYAPDVVITAGGSIVSRFVKKWLRSLPNLRHWHVGYGPSDNSVDTFCCLERRIEVEPATFLYPLARTLSSFCQAPDTHYQQWWQYAASQADESIREFVDGCDWCDLKATYELIRTLPRDWNLHVSNGTSVRYLQLAPYAGIHRIDSNRGVSGIDGCTSTAIGAAMMYKRPTALLTGDMSAQYDLGALATKGIPPRFRMFVLNNGGGDIFRFIGSTARLDECEAHFAVGTRLPLKQLAEAYDFDYYLADSAESLTDALSRLKDDTLRPTIVEIYTQKQPNADILRKYFGNKNSLVQ